MDVESHGTAVAGVAGAGFDNGIGLSGLEDCLVYLKYADIKFNMPGKRMDKYRLSASLPSGCPVPDAKAVATAFFGLIQGGVRLGI